MTSIKEDIENFKLVKLTDDNRKTPFKSSHISYVQAIQSHREQYAARLREFDIAKSTQSNKYLKKKLLDYEHSHRNLPPNKFGPLRMNSTMESEVQAKTGGEQSTQIQSNFQQMQSSEQVNQMSKIISTSGAELILDHGSPSLFGQNDR